MMSLRKSAAFLCFLLVILLFPLSSLAADNSAQQDFVRSLWVNYAHEYSYIYLDDVHEVRLNDDWTVDEYWHFRIKIQKEVAKELGEQKLYYNQDREDVLEIKAHVETPDGKVLPYTQIQDLPVYQGSPMYSDMRVKVITLPQINVGSIIDVECRSRIKKMLIKDQFTFVEYYPAAPHRHYRTAVTFPKNKNIRVKEYRPIVPPTRTETASDVTYTFEYNTSGSLDNIEPFLPPFHEFSGVTSFSSMPGWETIVDWFRGLIRENTIDIPEIRQKTEVLIAGKVTAQDKARAILEFLQDNLRYVSLSFGDNTVEPHPTDTIFKNGYGDCKDWALLAKQMLNLAGIEADVALFQDEMGGKPAAMLPLLEAFDHAVLLLRIEGKMYFVDPQLKNYDLGEFPDDYNNATVLAIKDMDYQFVQLAANDGPFVTQEIKVFTRPEKNGAAHYGVKAKLGVELSSYLRRAWEQFPELERDRFLDRIVSRFIAGQTVEDGKVQGIEERYGPLTLKFKFKNPYAYQVTGGIMIIKEPLEHFFPSPFASANRHFPISVLMNTTTRIIFKYTIPEGYQLQYLPEDFELKNKLWDFTRTSKSQGNVVRVAYRIGMKRGEIATSSYAQIKELWDQYYRKIKDGIILKRVDQP